MEAAVRAAHCYLENMDRGKLFVKVDLRYFVFDSLIYSVSFQQPAYLKQNAETNSKVGEACQRCPVASTLAATPVYFAGGQ